MSMNVAISFGVDEVVDKLFLLRGEFNSAIDPHLIGSKIHHDFVSPSISALGLAQRLANKSEGNKKLYDKLLDLTTTYDMVSREFVKQARGSCCGEDYSLSELFFQSIFDISEFLPDISAIGTILPPKEARYLSSLEVTADTILSNANMHFGLKMGKNYNLDKYLEHGLNELMPLANKIGIKIKSNLCKRFVASNDYLTKVLMPILWNSVNHGFGDNFNNDLEKIIQISSYPQTLIQDSKNANGLPIPIANGNYVIEIGDNGRGVPEENLEKIFEGFSTKNDKTIEHGQDLSTARRFLRNKGGEIKVESLKDVGTMFTILIPYSKVRSHICYE